MRVLLILVAVMGLVACYETPDERQNRERLEKERDDADVAAMFGVGPAADLDEPPAASRTPAAQQTCAGMSDAEAFVRCLYAGIGEGWLNAGEAPDGPDVLTDSYWATIHEMRTSFPAWRQIDPLCVCGAPGRVRLRSVRVVSDAGGQATAEVVLSGTPSEHARLDLVREDTIGWQVAEVTLHSGPA